MHKTELRAQAVARREKAAAISGDIGSALCKHLIALIDSYDVRTVAGYFPIRSEVNVLPLLQALGHRHVTALPEVDDQDKPLSFRRWAPGDPTIAGAFGIPSPEESAEIVVPDIVLVPLLAYDATGNRLGYGSGLYDRTLQSLRQNGSVWVLGVGYSSQRVDSLPEDPHDQRLDAVLTEDGLMEF